MINVQMHDDIPIQTKLGFELLFESQSILAGAVYESTILDRVQVEK